MKKGNTIYLALIIFALATLGICFCLYSGLKDKAAEAEETPKELNPVEETTKSEEVHELHEVEVEEAPTSKVDSKNFTYDPFAEDAGWGGESIFSGGLIIEGTGQIYKPEVEAPVVGDGNSTLKNIRELTPAEAQAAIMEEVKSMDYSYRIDEFDYSNGFGIYANPKYELSVGRIARDTGYINAPNNTEVGITELDSSKTLDEHRGEILTDNGYRTVYEYSDSVMEYNTPVTLGSGVNDFEKSNLYVPWRYEDLSLNDYGGQLFCDTTMKSKFGEGYYIEMYKPSVGMYYGYYLVEHNGRIFNVKGMSAYRDTLLDIVLATVDTCVYPY